MFSTQESSPAYPVPMTPCITIFHNTTTDTTTWSGKVVEAVAIAKGNQESLGTTFTAPNEQVPDLDAQEEYDEFQLWT
jgi:hypothetical protein